MSQLPGPPASPEVFASSRLATVAGLAIGPWILFALLMPTGTLAWVGFGLDAFALTLLAACRGRSVPLFRPRLVLVAVGGVTLSALLRFGVLPFWSPGDPQLEPVPTVEAFGRQLENTLEVLALITGLHLLSVAALGALLLLAFLRRRS